MNRVRESLGYVGALSTLVVWAVTTLQVISRYVTKKPMAFLPEICTLAFGMMIFLGSALVHLEEGHIGFDLVMRAVEARRQRAAAIVRCALHLLIAAFSLFLLFSGVQLLRETQPSKMPLMGISNAWKYASLPVGSLIIALGSLGYVAGKASGRGCEP
ncbi:MAG: TRAP transporter small permease subunit [Firmicutes bacterium]|jgi:TRAP-type C4-dicarboxylate transport system permease small subunit|nr:TRAP transporter small permease subunit [Bacillota bacterium]